MRMKTDVGLHPMCLGCRASCPGHPRTAFAVFCPLRQPSVPEEKIREIIKTDGESAVRKFWETQTQTKNGVVFFSKKSKFADDLKAKAREMVRAEKKTQVEVAKILGVSRSAVWSWLQEAA